MISAIHVLFWLNMFWKYSHFRPSQRITKVSEPYVWTSSLKYRRQGVWRVVASFLESWKQTRGRHITALLKFVARTAVRKRDSAIKTEDDLLSYSPHSTLLSVSLFIPLLDTWQPGRSGPKAFRCCSSCRYLFTSYSLSSRNRWQFSKKCLHWKEQGQKHRWATQFFSIHTIYKFNMMQYFPSVTCYI